MDQLKTIWLMQLPELLLPWYEKNKRLLPWREDKEPYHIWLSEIMLQQTRVEAVKGYYSRFLKELPDVAALAQAEDELLHKLWEGLGYYTRVRNLKRAAVVVMEKHDGVFPREYESVLALPGIGEYTAGAICSIAYDQPTPAVDGNVLRVISRLTEDETPVDLPAYKKAVADALRAMYPARAGDFTQALMELGATVCVPNGKPKCAECPCFSVCKAGQSGNAEKYPVRLPKRLRRKEELTVFILSCAGRYALRRRPDQGLLASLWEFPNVPGHLSAEQALAAVEEMGLRPRDITRQLEKKHIFTHVEWEMRGLYLEVAEASGDLCWLTEAEIETKAALPTTFRQFWEAK